MTKLSQIALEKCSHIIESIKHHPFNYELAAGTLDKAKFSYYIEQDTIYLRDFARSLAIISAKVAIPFMQDFLSFAEGALIAEQEVVHKFFRETLGLSQTKKLTTATLAYTSFLLRSTSLEAVEVGIAAVLPCFWVYSIVGTYIAESADKDNTNPYHRWIENYAGEDFTTAVERAIAIFDELADSASDSTRDSMLDAFYKSTMLEWHFWNDCYNMEEFDIS